MNTNIRELNIDELNTVSGSGFGVVTTGLTGLKHSPVTSPTTRTGASGSSGDGDTQTGGSYGGDSAGGNASGGRLGDDNHPRLC